MYTSNKLNRIYSIKPLVITALEMLATVAFFAILSLPLFIFGDGDITALKAYMASLF